MEGKRERRNVPVLLRRRGFKKKLFRQKGKEEKREKRKEKKREANRRTRNKPWAGISTEEMEKKNATIFPQCDPPARPASNGHETGMRGDGGLRVWYHSSSCFSCCQTCLTCLFLLFSLSLAQKKMVSRQHKDSSSRSRDARRSRYMRAAGANHKLNSERDLV